MTAKRLFSLSAFFALLLGLAWMLFPESLLSSWGISSNPALVYLSRRYSVQFLGSALVLWFARNDSQTQTGHAVVAGNFITSMLMAGMSLYGVLSSTINSLGWMAFGLEILLTSGFGYFLFIVPRRHTS